MIRFLLGFVIGALLTETYFRQEQAESAATPAGGRVDELTSAANNPHPQRLRLNAGDGTPDQRDLANSR